MKKSITRTIIVQRSEEKIFRVNSIFISWNRIKREGVVDLKGERLKRAYQELGAYRRDRMGGG